MKLFTEKNMEQKNQEVKIQIKATDAVMAGTYANNLIVHMNREEFVLDFVNIVPPHATLNSRVAVSPGNLKRMLSAVQESMDRYEREFGKLPVPPPTLPPTEFVQ